MDTRTVVVVGHGMVGHRFVEALRRRDTEGRWRVVVLAEESRAAYDRVALSSYLGEKTGEELALAGDDFHADELIDLHLDDRAVAVDRAARTVTTAGGRTVAYDELVLATGSYPSVPAGMKEGQPTDLAALGFEVSSPSRAVEIAGPELTVGAPA